MQSSDAAATFLGSRGHLDASKLEVKGSTGDQIRASSGRSGSGLPEQSLEDSVQLDGVDATHDTSLKDAISIKSLKQGECSKGACNNGTISEGDFVFAVATHQHNEPTLFAGRAGRLVRLMLAYFECRKFVCRHLWTRH